MSIIKKNLDDVLNRKKTNEEKLHYKKLAKLEDKDINYDDIPELNDSFWKNAKLQDKSRKISVTLRLDPEMVDFYKSKSVDLGKGYQTLISEVLKSYMKYSGK